MSGRAWTVGPWNAHAGQDDGCACMVISSAMANVIAANDEFRRALPADWQSDPVNDACDAARTALAKATEGGSHG